VFRDLGWRRRIGHIGWGDGWCAWFWGCTDYKLNENTFCCTASNWLRPTPLSSTRFTFLRDKDAWLS
jgi:hypothetical protein